MRGVAKDLCWMDEEARGKALVSVEEIIYSHAVGIDSDNCAIRQWSGLQEHRKRFADFRTTLRQEAARDIRINLRRDIRRKLSARLRMDKGEQLNRLLAGYFDRRETHTTSVHRASRAHGVFTASPGNTHQTRKPLDLPCPSVHSELHDTTAQSSAPPARMVGRRLFGMCCTEWCPSGPPQSAI